MKDDPTIKSDVYGDSKRLTDVFTNIMKFAVAQVAYGDTIELDCHKI